MKTYNITEAVMEILQSLAPVDAEPVGYAYANQDYIGSVIGAKGEWAPHGIPLYTHPAPLRELSDDESMEVFSTCHNGRAYPQDNISGPRAMRITEARAVLRQARGV